MHHKRCAEERCGTFSVFVTVASALRGLTVIAFGFYHFVFSVSFPEICRGILILLLLNCCSLHRRKRTIEVAARLYRCLPNVQDGSGATSTTSLSTRFQSGNYYHYPNTVYPSLRSSYLDSEKSWLSNLHLDCFLSPPAAVSSAAPATTAQISPSQLIPASLFYPLQNIPFSLSVMMQCPPTTVSSVSNCTSKTLSGSGRSSASLNADVVPPSTWGSQDSGRATGGLASSLSPADDTAPRESPEVRSVYEFEIPNTLVGLIIGIKGKTIKELCLRTEVKMIIRPHHTPSKLETHQICAVEGSRENINKCLRMMRRRFPAARFPELNLRPVLPPAFPDPPTTLYGTRPVQLTLPEGERCRVICSATINVGHFFLQQPQHPTFNALQRLDYYMLGVYMQPAGVPDLPKPVDVDKLCVAPAFDGWYRAVTLDYYQEEDEVMVRYVDYGGYGRIPRSDLRQIRTDFMTLPFQATECYLAHIMPADGTTKWSDEALKLFQTLTQGRMLECYVVGYHIEDSRPFVEIFATDENNRVDRIDSALLDANLAKAWDPSKVRPVLPRLVPPLSNTRLVGRTGNEVFVAE
uniref:Tudor domain-containing protein n=2 Tax=Wuchereria bancrofti TaxID=6293 RepID=A0A1I8EI68_WUCBA